jgi:very-short-patch-repair endonuclease
MIMKTYNPYRVDHARAMRKGMTNPERRLWFGCLLSLPHTFRRQRPIGRYIVDFYCSDLRLVIEVDGDSHYNDLSIQHDEKRTLFLKNKGLRVIRFTNYEVSQQFEAVKTRIFSELKSTLPPLCQ